MSSLRCSIAVGGLAIVAGLLVRGVPASLLAGAVALVLGAAGLAVLGMRAVQLLDDQEQLRVQRLAGTTVHNGPGLVLLNPLGYRTACRVKAETLGAMDFARVVDSVTGAERVERGPKMLFLGPYERVAKQGQGTSLSGADGLVVQDRLSGDRRVIRGPCIWFPRPHEDAQKCAGVSLSQTEYLVVEDRLTGAQRTVRGPCVWFPEPYEEASAKRTALSLQDDEFVRLKDLADGRRWVQRGRALVFLEPTWAVEGAGSRGLGVCKAWVLKAHEYLRLLDTASGRVAVHRGEATVFPRPDEQLLDGGVQQAVQVDGEHAALVRDGATGQLRLVTEPQLFVPGPTESIEEVRPLIRLADHEAMIVKDREGVFHFRYGSEARRGADEPRSFFLPPYAEVVKVWWSRGPRRERKDVSFERFDLRPHFMRLEFNCRTADNVELVLEGVLFWELLDLPTMWQKTGDTSGDMAVHIRSQFIQCVARATLKAFMETLHEISQQVMEEDRAFYTERGLKIHSLEITHYRCADRSTAGILEQIIQETTCRMNRLSQAESENEVSLFRTQGQVEEARLSGELQQLQREQAREEAHSAGLAEADRVSTFLGGLEQEVPKLEDRIRMWQVLRKRRRSPSSPRAAPASTSRPATWTSPSRPGPARARRPTRTRRFD